MPDTPKIRAIVVDDEQPARRLIRNLLKTESDIDIIAECRDGREAVAAIKEQEPDLAFLDVQMPVVSGMDVLDKIGSENMPDVIFVTAYDEYAVKAFEVHAVDYLLKPFTTERFYEALRRVRERRGKQSTERTTRLNNLLESWQYDRQGADAVETRNAAGYVDRLIVRIGQKIRPVDVNRIHWIEAADHYVRLHTDDKSYLLYDTMTGLEEKLDPQRFIRVHRSAIVNVDAVREIESAGFGACNLTLQDDSVLRVSRSRRKKLRPVLQRLGRG